MIGEVSGYIYHPAYGAYRNQDANQDVSLEHPVPEAYFPDVNAALTTPSDSDNVSISEPEGDFFFDNGNDW
jgi:hypothetical protein